MEQELPRTPGDPYASAKLAGWRSRRTTDRAQAAAARSGWPTVPSSAHPERYELLLHRRWAKAPAAPEQGHQPLPPGPGPATGSAAGSFAAQLKPQRPMLLRQGRERAALALAEQAARSAPELATGWLNLGLIRRRRARSPGAGGLRPPPWSAIPTTPRNRIRTCVLSFSAGNSMRHGPAFARQSSC